MKKRQGAAHYINFATICVKKGNKMIRILVYAESFLEGGNKEWSPLGTTEW